MTVPVNQASFPCILWSVIWQVGKVFRTADALVLIRCGVLSSESEECLKCGHGMFSPVIAKDEFSQITLKLTSAHAVIGTDKPLLQIANGAVGHRYD